jgi:hypothetical protein
MRLRVERIGRETPTMGEKSPTLSDFKGAKYRVILVAGL